MQAERREGRQATRLMRAEPILQKEKGKTGKGCQENKVQPGEMGKVASFFASWRLCILFIGNQAGQGSDKRAQPPCSRLQAGQIIFL